MYIFTHRKHKKHSKKPPPSDVVPLVSYQSAEDDDETHDTSPPPVFGPFLPTHDTASKHAEPPAAKPTTIATTHESKQSESGQAATETEENSDNVGARKNEYGDEIQKLKELHEKFRKRITKQTKHPVPKDKDAASSGDSANFPPVSEFPEVSAEVFPEAGCSVSEAQDEVPVTVEEEAIVRYEFVNRRYEGDVVDPEAEMDLDVEDIDKELDMALVRHKVSVYHTLCDVLYVLLPPKSDSQHNLRKRCHNLTLPEKKGHLAAKNFIIRLLYKETY